MFSASLYSVREQVPVFVVCLLSCASMAVFALCAVFLTLAGQTTGQFYDPSILFRGFDIPFAGFLRRFSSPTVCDDPCKSTTCPSGSSCRVVQVNCFQPPCRLRPTCMAEKYVEDDALMNPCLINRPVMSTSGKELGTCSEDRSTTCPLGSRCTRALYGQGSKCCYAPLGCLHAKTAPRRQSLEPVSRKSPPSHCPALSSHTTCEKGCFVKEDCPGASVCCPTACGTRACVPPSVYSSSIIVEERHGIKPKRIDKSLRRRKIVVGPNGGGEAVISRVSPRISNRFKRPVFQTGTHKTHPGTCRNPLHYRTCRNQCTYDSQCGVGKCCATRCGTRICTYDRTGRYLG